MNILVLGASDPINWVLFEVLGFMGFTVFRVQGLGVWGESFWFPCFRVRGLGVQS